MIDEEILKQSCIDFKKKPIAGNAIWEDCTSYSKSDKERVPTTFSTHIGGMKLVITCGHIHAKGEWLASCHSLNIDFQLLKVKTPIEAGEQIILLCKEKVNKMYYAFGVVGL